MCVRALGAPFDECLLNFVWAGKNEQDRVIAPSVSVWTFNLTTRHSRWNATIIYHMKISWNDDSYHPYTQSFSLSSEYSEYFLFCFLSLSICLGLINWIKLFCALPSHFFFRIITLFTDVILFKLCVCHSLDYSKLHFINFPVKVFSASFAIEFVNKSNVNLVHRIVHINDSFCEHFDDFECELSKNSRKSCLFFLFSISTN